MHRLHSLVHMCIDAQTTSLFKLMFCMQALTQHIDLTDEAALVSVATSLTATDLSGGTDGPDALRREDVGSAASKVGMPNN